MRSTMLRKGPARPVSWCVGPQRPPSLQHGPQKLKEPPEGPEDEGGGGNPGPRGALARSTSYQALHSALARLYRIDDFVLQRIGQGFFSEVFKVRHRVTGDVMVLKVNKLISNRHNMLREVELMNRLQHPNILTYYGVCIHEGQVHALTEYINGGSLDTLLQNCRVELPWITRVSLALDMARGMAYLHARRVFHRDLTSKNVLIKHSDESGKPRVSAVIADFGLAAPIPSDRSVRLRQVGSPYWMAPEVIRGDWYDHRVDVFSFGIIVCEMIARCEADPDVFPRTPNFGVHYSAFFTMCQSDCPPSLLEMAFQCCQINPDSRPSFQELTRNLERLFVHLSSDTRPVNNIRKVKVCHRRSLSDDSFLVVRSASESGGSGGSGGSTQPTPPNAPTEMVGGSTPQDVLERMSAADPYFQPTSATVNPFNQVKLPAKSELVVQEGGRCCHSLPDSRALALSHTSRPHEGALNAASNVHLAASETSLCSPPSPTPLCPCAHTCSATVPPQASPNGMQCQCLLRPLGAPPSQDKTDCRCGLFESATSDDKPNEISGRLFPSIWLHTEDLLHEGVVGTTGHSPRADAGGGHIQGPLALVAGAPHPLAAAHLNAVRRRGSGESGFFSVEDELCLSYSELSTTSMFSADEEDLAGHHFIQRSSSVVTDSSEDLSSLGCCHDLATSSITTDDETASAVRRLGRDLDLGGLEHDYSTDIKSIVEFFERGNGSMRSINEAERSRRLTLAGPPSALRKERLVPLLRTKFSPSPRAHFGGGPGVHPKISLAGNSANGNISNSNTSSSLTYNAQAVPCSSVGKTYMQGCSSSVNCNSSVNSSGNGYTKDSSGGMVIKLGCRQSCSQRREAIRAKERPKLYITEGTVRAKRNIFESK